MDETLRPAFASFCHILDDGEPRNYGETRLADLKTVVRKLLDQLADPDDQTIHSAEMFYIGAMLCAASLEFRAQQWDNDDVDLEEELDDLASRLRGLAMQTMVYKIAKWNE